MAGMIMAIVAFHVTHVCGLAHPEGHVFVLFSIWHSSNRRGLGTHISFVRSVRMDSWTLQQVELMKRGGNQRCNEFLQAHGVTATASTVRTDDVREMIRQKYDSPAAKLYKQVLKAEVEGRPVPTELPKEDTKAPPTTQQPARRRMEGFGSSPPPEPEPVISGKNILYVAVPVVAAAALWLLMPH